MAENTEDPKGHAPRALPGATAPGAPSDAEERIGQAEQRYQQLFEEAPVMYVITSNQEGTPLIVECNRQFLATLGYGRQEVVGRPLADFYTPASRARLLEEGGYRRALEGYFTAEERQLVTRDGRVIETLLQAVPELETARRVFGTRAMFVDITERKRAEGLVQTTLALQRVRNEILLMQKEEDWKHIVEVVQEQLQTLVQFNACSISLVDWQRGTSVVHYLGADGTRLTGQPGLSPAFEQARETGRYVYRRNQAEMARYADTAELFALQVRAVIDVPFSGGTLAINSLEEEAFGTRDIEILEQFAQILSEAHRRMEDLKNLAVAEAQFRKAQRLEAIGRLAGGVAHDFNNLLTVVTGYSELVLAGLGPDHSQRASVEEIQRAAERGTVLVRQLLAFSSRQVLQPAVLNLNAVIAELEKMLQRLIGEDIELVAALGAALGAVQADRAQLEQVLMNLVVNARDAMPQGGRLVIETRNAELGQGEALRQGRVAPGPYVVMAVRDTGVGMDAEIQARIFEPFFTTKEQGKGTGLGLATVYGIVQQSGGHIAVHSAPGQGATFEIYLPRSAAQPSPGQEEDRASARPGRAAPAPGEGGTILLVEDEDAVRQLVSRVLRRRGYTVLEARGGEEALRIGTQHAGALQLLVTDLVMPGMNGQQLAERLVASQEGMKVLYMSGYTEGIIAEEGLLGPGAAFIQKPFTPGGLVHKIQEVLGSP